MATALGIEGHTCPDAFGPVARQHIVAGVCGGAQLLTSWPGKETGRRKDWSPTISFKGMSLT
jgi:hypothetical protein